MIQARFLLSICFTLLAITGCDQQAREYQRKTAILQSINIPAEVQANLARGDRSLRVCNGVGAAYIPGLAVYETDPAVEPLVQKYGLYSMPDVSDSIDGEAHAKYIHAAHDYAEKYNRLLLQELGEVFEK